MIFLVLWSMKGFPQSPGQIMAPCLQDLASCLGEITNCQIIVKVAVILVMFVSYGGQYIDFF